VLRDGVTLDLAVQNALAGMPLDARAQDAKGQDAKALDARAQGAAEPRLQSTVRSLSFGAIRGYFRYVAILGRMSSSPVKSLDFLVQGILCVALFELEDARTPEYAVVDAAVQTAKASDAARAAGLVNAVLRRYLRERAAVDAEVAKRPATRHAAPIWLADRFRADWPVRWTQLLAASDTQAPMWLRVNSRMDSASGYLQRLNEAGMEARIEERVPQALVLRTPCDVHQLPGFDTGLVSVQDLGAQCVQFVLGLAPGQRVLDACAAPGGKTALIAEREANLAQLVAVDVDPKRLALVRQNLHRGGLRADLIHADAAAPAAWWDGKPFDRILLDAPCSALGVIRRHPDIRVRKSPSDIDKLPALQRDLLKAAWSMLARGGRLVYVTCTVTRSENRDVIGEFLGTSPDASIVQASEWAGWPDFGETDGYGRQILPGEAGADGFYYAALSKQ
jgi:16S rRNA (cytosine967-C5)-methyltransferase